MQYCTGYAEHRSTTASGSDWSLLAHKSHPRALQAQRNCKAAALAGHLAPAAALRQSDCKQSNPATTTAGPEMNAVNSPVSNVQPPHTVSASSPRPQPVASRPVAFEGGIERRPSVSYGHHRQTSIVHGIQHSRNASFAASPAISPLSPEIIAAFGAGAGGASDFTANTPQMEAPDPPSGLPPHSRPNGSVSSNMTGSTLASGGSSVTVTQKKMERMQSGGKTRHHHSHSRHHHQAEQKTVGEYALHVLFNSVCVAVARLGMWLTACTSFLAMQNERSISALQTL